MFQRPIAMDDMEFNADFYNDSFLYVIDAFRAVMQGAITPEALKHGLVISKRNLNEIDITAGVIFDGSDGTLYHRTQDDDVSLFGQLPNAHERWVCVAAKCYPGVEVEQSQVDFLVDSDTDQMEARAVALTKSNTIEYNLIVGDESSLPVKPGVPDGDVCLGYVRLSSAGIQEVLPYTLNNLPNLFEVAQRQKAIELWMADTTIKVMTNRTDIALLNEKVRTLATKHEVNLLGGRVGQNENRLGAVEPALARSLEASGIEDAVAPFQADRFLDSDETDTTYTGYNARVQEGVRFPWAATWTGPLTVDAASTPAVEAFDDFLLPSHTHERRLYTDGYSGSLSIRQYTHKEQVFVHKTMSRTRTVLGPAFKICTNSGWHYGGYWKDKTAGIYTKDGEDYQAEYISGQGEHQIYRLQKISVTTTREPYIAVNTKTTSITGSQIAQSFLNTHHGWMTRIGVTFDKLEATGSVTLTVCETDDGGAPLQSSALAAVTLDASALKVHPTETIFEFSEPVYLAAGSRYAIVLTTMGDHNIATVSGQRYVDGTLFHSTDGAYYEGNLLQDMMFSVYYASFDRPRVVIDVPAGVLDGGIGAIDLLCEQIAPPATEAFLEFRRDGHNVWQPLARQGGNEAAEHLDALPPLIHLRYVLLGTRDLMPGVRFKNSQLKLARPSTTFKHISTERALETASDNIEVSVVVEHWDAAKHTVSVALESDGTPYAPVATKELVQGDFEGRPRVKKTFNFTPETGVGIDRYHIIITGETTDAMDAFHVAERFDTAV